MKQLLCTYFIAFAIVFSLSGGLSAEEPGSMLQKLTNVTHQLQEVFLNSLKKISQINAAGDAQINDLVSTAVAKRNFTSIRNDVNNAIKSTVQKVLNVTHDASKQKIDLVNSIGASPSDEKRSIRRAYKSINKVVARTNRKINNLVTRFTNKLTSNIDRALNKVLTNINSRDGKNIGRVSGVIGTAENVTTSNFKTLYGNANAANNKAATKIQSIIQKAVSH